MFFSLSSWIGKRFIYGCRRKSIVSLISLISIIGISSGVAILIIVLSTMNGFEKELNLRIISLIPQGEIEFAEKNKKWKQIFFDINKLPEISYSSPYIDFLGLIEHKKKTKTIQIRGISIYLENKFNNLNKFIEKKSWNNFIKNKNQIIIGNGIAKFFKINIKDWITITLTEKINKKNILNIKKINLQVVGFFKTQGTLDYNLGIVPLVDAQKYLGFSKKSITGITIKVKNPFFIKKTLKKILKFINSDVYINNWLDQYSYIYRDIIFVKTIVYIAMTMVVLLSCFNNISVLIIITKDKNKDIAILKTLGIKNILIKKIFLWYGFLIGFIGNLLGLIIGILISINSNILINIIESLFKEVKIFSTNTYFIDFLPSELKLLDIIKTFLITIILSLISSFYPSHRAVSLTPIFLLKKN